MTGNSGSKEESCSYPSGDRDFCRKLCMRQKKVKEPDAASQGVMKITPIPSPTPTVAPRQVNKDAVAQSGSVTMVNEYLVQKEEQSASGTSTSDQQKASSESVADGGGGHIFPGYQCGYSGRFFRERIRK